jgi:PrtD family type I secretion system ABC transporter
MSERKRTTLAQQGAGHVSNPMASVIGPAWIGFGVVFVLSFFINLSVLVSPLYMQNIFDRVLQTHHTETLVWLTLVTIGVLAVIGVLEALRGIVLARVGRWWDETLREDVLTAAVEQARLTGRNTTAAVQDLHTVRSFVGTNAILPFFDAPWMPLFIGMIALLHPLLGAIALVSAIVLVVMAFVLDRGSRVLSQGAVEQAQKGMGLAQALVRHADSAHAMGMLSALIGRYKTLQEPVIQSVERNADFAAVITGATKFFRLAVQIFILGVGAWLVLHNQLSSGGMIAASIILGRALAPAEQALGAWRGFVQARSAHKRLTELLTRSEKPQPTIHLPPPKGLLEIENLSFLLAGQDRPVLRQVTLTVPAGRTLALIGPSASGKSSLCKLIVGSWNPTQGHVRLDGASVSRWNREQASRYVGYMAQTVELFGGTVRDNIARFTVASDEAVVSAAQLAGVHEMILRLPKGYETDIGEGGAYLSGGQRQRIGLARAVFGDPRLVVLDEPNSNLDNEGETALLKAIASLRERGTTVILVSHRMTALSSVDYVAILRDGALERFGERESVIRDLRTVAAPLKQTPGVEAPMARPAQA